MIQHHKDRTTDTTSKWLLHIFTVHTLICPQDLQLPLMGWASCSALRLYHFGLILCRENLNKSTHSLSQQKYYNTKYHKKTKARFSRLDASYDIQPGNGEGLFLFRRFINLWLTYLHTQLTARTHTGLITSENHPLAIFFLLHHRTPDGRDVLLPIRQFSDTSTV